MALGAVPAMSDQPVELKWHLDIDSARAAGAESGKPIYVFIFSPAQPACMRMRSETLDHPGVKALLTRFEVCAIDSTVEANHPLVDKYAWGVSADAAHGTRFGSMPANLFTDPRGKEHYIRWGFMPPAAFIPTLQNVLELARLKGVLQQTPDDARAHADLGGVMLRLDLHQAAPEHLNRAVALDPQNRAGALESASLGLTILSIPDDPAKAYEALAKYMKDFPRTRRSAEVRYFQAVALVAQGTNAKYREALKVLEPFKADDRTRPEYDSVWTLPALELDMQIRVHLGSG